MFLTPAEANETEARAKELVGKTVWIKPPGAADWIVCTVTASPAFALITVSYFDPHAFSDDSYAMAYHTRGRTVTRTLALDEIGLRT